MITKDDKEEIDRIKNKLLFQEKVEAVAKQSSFTNNAPWTPSILFATSHRVIEKLCYPLRPKFNFLEYDKIISVELKKGIIRSSIIFIVPGETIRFDALDKDKAAFMVDVIESFIKKHSQKRERNRAMNNSKNFIRKHFNEETKEKVLRLQGHRCADCNKILTIVEFDHINGDRSDNSEDNCQALCPNCHAYKSRT